MQNQRIKQATTARWVLFATILASAMAFIDGTALNVVRPTLQEDLNATGAQLLWVDNAYLVLLAALILVGGSLGDHFGRKRIYMIGIAIFSVGSLIAGLSPTTNILIAGRTVQGIGGAMMIPGSLAIISAYFSAEERGKAIGTWSSLTTLTVIMGPVIGGELAEAGFWRGVFFLNLPLALLSLLALYFKVPESRDETIPPELDYPGVILVTMGLAGISYGFIQAPEDGFGNTLVLAGLLIGLIALIAFVIVEGRSKHPMLPLRYFKSRTFSGANVLTFFLYAGLIAAVMFIPWYLVQIQDYAQSDAGRVMLPFGISLVVLSRWSGGLVDRFGPRIPLTIGPVIVGVGFLLMRLPGITNGASDYWTTFFPAILAVGVGMGITIAPLTTTVMGAVSSSHSGVASGVNNAVTRIAGVFAVAILGAVALFFFNDTLATQTEVLDLTDENRAALEQQAKNLFGTQPPDELAPEIRRLIEERIATASLDTFRLIMLIAAGLAWLSALLGVVLIDSQLTVLEDGSSSVDARAEGALS